MRDVDLMNRKCPTCGIEGVVAVRPDMRRRLTKFVHACGGETCFDSAREASGEPDMIIECDGSIDAEQARVIMQTVRLAGQLVGPPRWAHDESDYSHALPRRAAEGEGSDG